MWKFCHNSETCRKSNDIVSVENVKEPLRKLLSSLDELKSGSKETLDGCQILPYSRYPNYWPSNMV
jgi:hypothetical protein